MAGPEYGWVDDNTRAVERMEAEQAAAHYQRLVMIEYAATGVAALALVGGAIAAGRALYRALTPEQP